MKYLILILLASCVSQQTKTYYYLKCPVGYELYSDNLCRKISSINFSEIDREIYREEKRKKKKIKKIDCKKVLTDINFCAR